MKALLVAVGMTGLVLATAPAHANFDLVKKARCNACHAVDKKMVGPSFQEIGAKYKGQGDAPGKLFEKVRAGGAGNWGQVPMTPNGPDKINDQDLKTVIQWILSGAPS